MGAACVGNTRPSRVARSPARRTHHTARPYYTPSKNIASIRLGIFFREGRAQRFLVAMDASAVGLKAQSRLASPSEPSHVCPRATTPCLTEEGKWVGVGSAQGRVARGGEGEGGKTMQVVDVHQT